MDAVNFSSMADGTREDYEFLAARPRPGEHGHITHVLKLLELLKGPKLGYKIDRYVHSLQTATRAQRAGADEETIVCVLLHDIGDIIAPLNHDQAAAAILRPYVSHRNYWVVANHALFLGNHYFHYFDRDRNARDQFLDHPHYDACVEFCEWDQLSFDPDYESLPLETFAPMVWSVLGREHRDVRASRYDFESAPWLR